MDSLPLIAHKISTSLLLVLTRQLYEPDQLNRRYATEGLWDTSYIVHHLGAISDERAIWIESVVECGDNTGRQESEPCRAAPFKMVSISHIDTLAISGFVFSTDRAQPEVTSYFYRLHYDLYEIINRLSGSNGEIKNAKY